MTATATKRRNHKETRAPARKARDLRKGRPERRAARRRAKDRCRETPQPDKAASPAKPANTPEPAAAPNPTPKPSAPPKPNSREDIARHEPELTPRAGQAPLHDRAGNGEQRDRDAAAEHHNDDDGAAEQDSLPLAGGLLPPLTPDQRQALVLAREALDAIERGFLDRWLPLGLGLHAARVAAWDAAEAEAQAEGKQIRSPNGRPNYHNDSYRKKFRLLLQVYFPDYWFSSGTGLNDDDDDEQHGDDDDDGGDINATNADTARMKYRRDLRDALLFIVENLHHPADPEHHNKLGFLPWYLSLQSEGRRLESPKRLCATYRSEVLGLGDPKVDNRGERTRQFHLLEQRLVNTENANTALQAEIQKRDAVFGDPGAFADAAMEHGRNFARAAHHELGIRLAKRGKRHG